MVRDMKPEWGGLDDDEFSRDLDARIESEQEAGASAGDPGNYDNVSPVNRTPEQRIRFLLDHGAPYLGREEGKHLIATIDQLRAELAERTRERDAMESSLRNVLAMSRRLKLKANRNVKTETPELDTLIRFCAESGVVPTILRKEPPND